jgi:hypothetical protein
MRIRFPSKVKVATTVASSTLFFASLRVFAIEADPAPAIRGSLGVSLEDLSLDNHLGQLVFLLNGACALTFGLVACLARTARRDNPSRNRNHSAKLSAGISPASH